MSPDTSHYIRPGNKILGSLSDKDLKRIKTKLEPFDLNFAGVINDPGQRTEYIYFPDSGIISLLGTLGDGANLEVGIVSSEGAVPLCPFLGTHSSPVREIVQGQGLAHRMKTPDFLDECSLSPQLTKMLLHFTRSLMLQISQLAVCFCFHKIEARLARWLLMTSDYMGSDEFQMTHESLSNMLGVRREGVSVAAHRLQEQGVISYSRGSIKILDHKLLELVSCPCYAILKQNI